MRWSPFTEPPARLEAKTLKLRVKRSLARAPKRGARTRACHIELPQNLWDRIVLLMFTCCLFTFLHAFFGFGVDEDMCGSNDISVLPRATLSVSWLWNWGSNASNGDQGIHARGVTRVMVDWHGSYELLPSTTSSPSPASILRDAFPDPTPSLAEARGRAPDGRTLSATTNVKALVDDPLTFYESPYDPFRLEFEDSVDGGEVRGLYLMIPTAGSSKPAPQGARTRRFGRCSPQDKTCL